MPRIVVLAAVRTPIGKFLGSFAPLSAVDLGAHAVRAAIGRAGIAPDAVDEVLMGQARQLGSGPNPARQVALGAGCPETTVATTVNKACGSGLETVAMARDALLLGDAEVVVAGGMEHMTNIPFLLPDFRHGYRLGHQKGLDGNYQDGFTCAILKEPMGMTAEYLADDYGISRAEQDAFAFESHRRAAAAQAEGVFEAEIEPVDVPGRKGAVTRVATDEHVRPDVTPEALAKLPPVFRPDGGTVHAGNSSGITDGAAALVLTTAEYAERHGLTPIAEVGPSAAAGVSPRIMGIGPVPATRKLLEKTGGQLADFDLVEINEAFAAQMIACLRELDIDQERLNVHGGAIALGHPIGATGARIAVTLIHAMRRRGADRGLASLCMSGGMGMSMEFRRV